MYDVTLIPGDGIGPEVAAAARQVIDASGVKTTGISRRPVLLRSRNLAPLCQIE